MSVNNSTFNIIEIGVVFQSSLEQACLFTQLGNMSTIIVCKHLVSKDGICNLGDYISFHTQTVRESQQLKLKFVEKT